MIETTAQSGSYVLGFRIDPESKLEDVKQQLHSLWTVYSANPIFGVKFEQTQKALPLEQITIKHQPDMVEIIDDDDVDFFSAAYYADVDKKSDLKPEYNKEIGLAVEAMPKGVTISQLWNVVSK